MNTKKPFAVFDIDGTLIRWQLYHAIADSLAKLGYIDPKTHQKIKDARMVWKRRTHPESFKAYQTKLITWFEKMLLDISVKQYNEAAKAVFEEHKDQVYTYTRDLIKQLKKDNYLLFAISGSQIEIVKMISKYYGFDDYIGTIYEHESDKFSGAVTLYLEKHLVLEEMVKRHRATWQGSIAVGDSTSDISMLEAVEQPIAFNPERRMFDYAKDKNWKIVLERKNMIYELESRDGKYLLAKTD